MTADQARDHRESHEWRQEDLAALLGVERKAINRWETGETHVPAWLNLAYKGLSFTHGDHCPCPICYTRRPPITANQTISRVTGRAIAKNHPAAA